MACHSDDFSTLSKEEEFEIILCKVCSNLTLELLNNIRSQPYRESLRSWYIRHLEEDKLWYSNYTIEEDSKKIVSPTRKEKKPNWYRWKSKLSDVERLEKLEFIESEFKRIEAGPYCRSITPYHRRINNEE